MADSKRISVKRAATRKSPAVKAGRTKLVRATKLTPKKAPAMPVSTASAHRPKHHSHATDDFLQARIGRTSTGGSHTYPHDPRHDAPKHSAHPEHTTPQLNRLSVKIGGEAGFGIATSGLALTTALARGGLSVMDYTEYPSLIRGGHNTFLVRVDSEKVHAALSSLNVLIALNRATVLLHEHELTDDALIIYDSDEIELDPNADLARQSFFLMGVPLETLAVRSAGAKIARNVVALGAFVAATEYDLELLNGVIADIFGGKGKTEVIAKNQAAAKAGYDYVRDNFPEQFTYRLSPLPPAAKQAVVTGSDAIALGAIAAGCQFYAAYPMTPATPVMHYLAATQAKTGMVVRHAEDEIAAINLAIGASFAGVRAMTGTAGGGFALMVESLGLAAITETPLVIMETQRPGPATGLPTWTDQSDLRFLMHAAQGEFPRVILAPGDVDECFSFTGEAFNLADRYQLPVFVVSDKLLAESHWTTQPFDGDSITIDRGKIMTSPQLKELDRRFKRFELTRDGVSPRTRPGQEGGIFMANSDESDEFGYTSEDAANRIKRTHKRFRKMDDIAKEVPSPKLHGPKQAEITFVGWGSTKGAILEAIKHLAAHGIRANFLQITTMWPFPSKVVESTLQHAEQLLLVENNYTAQLGGVIREQTGVVLNQQLLKYNGRPIYPEEVYHKALEILGRKDEF